MIIFSPIVEKFGYCKGKLFGLPAKGIELSTVWTFKFFLNQDSRQFSQHLPTPALSHKFYRFASSSRVRKNWQLMHQKRRYNTILPIDDCHWCPWGLTINESLFCKLVPCFAPLFMTVTHSCTSIHIMTKELSPYRGEQRPRYYTKNMLQ